MSQVTKKLLAACVLLLTLQLALSAIQRSNENCLAGSACGHKLSCNKFYVCVEDTENQGSTYRIIMDCPPGMNFNGCYCQKGYACVP